MKQVELSRAELAWLRTKIEARYLEKDQADLVVNSSLKSYRDLCDSILSSVRDSSNEYVSANLLRKLFYYGLDEPAVVFRVGFIDACYRFISNGSFNREAYLNALLSQPDLDESLTHPALTKEVLESAKPVSKKILTFSYRTLEYGLVFAFVLIVILLAVRLIDFRTIPWAVSSPPHHTRWVCEYADGTRVYNRFRKYRTHDEVLAYYDSEHRAPRAKRVLGDCNSYMLDSLQNHIPVCYDHIDKLKAMEARHGTPLTVFRDTLSLQLHGKVE